MRQAVAAKEREVEEAKMEGIEAITKAEGLEEKARLAEERVKEMEEKVREAEFERKGMELKFKELKGE